MIHTTFKASIVDVAALRFLAYDNQMGVSEYLRAIISGALCGAAPPPDWLKHRTGVPHRPELAGHDLARVRLRPTARVAQTAPADSR